MWRQVVAAVPGACRHARTHTHVPRLPQEAKSAIDALIQAVAQDEEAAGVKVCGELPAGELLGALPGAGRSCHAHTTPLNRWPTEAKNRLVVMGSQAATFGTGASWHSTC